jgi:hypothetical protein
MRQYETIRMVSSPSQKPDPFHRTVPKNRLQPPKATDALNSCCGMSSPMKAPLSVFAARLDRKRVHDHGIGIDHGVEANFLLEDVIARIDHRQAEIALAANHLVFAGFVTGEIGVGILENRADKPFADVRDFLGARLVRKYPDFGFVHEAIAD